MKKLNEFTTSSLPLEIKNIKIDSRKVEQGDLFVCIHGKNCDHHEFISSAIKKGASAIVVDKEVSSSVPIIQVENTNQALIELCEKFYDVSNLSLIGVTGTDGKTTTSTLIYHLMNSFYKTAYFGTNGFHLSNGEKGQLENTTPLIDDLYRLLEKVKKTNHQYAVMEVSSEALKYKRVGDLSFTIGILTNITEDHLDVHQGMEDYILSKAKLFERVKEDGYSIINLDDEHAQEIIPHCHGQVFTYGQTPECHFYIHDIKENGEFIITYQGKDYPVKTPLIGLYNIYNVTSSLLACTLLGLPLVKLIEKVALINHIDGRGEFLDYGQPYQIFLDYAHTENALSQVLTALKRKEHQKLIVVLGSAGGREKEKRPKMGNVVLENANMVVFTMDDPRNENVFDIIRDLIKESKKMNYVIIVNRKDAIFYALSIAKENDIVAILGKGRDNYMAIENKKIPYSDIDVIELFFKEKDKKESN